ncbi:hypothetical protein [Methylobacterium nodulans]|uniref:Type IV pilus assembly PilZ n=1 Tax=Methylobacterium nodulans (strain LMG 21967 / CNCM I-2342 / ORS 2060) TaxID=460265 RepID=B8IJ43_METNO|nr:hypothetical protein [Methylobacterium nodulans]ACL61838.1 type IV pilus assembly PilZ [Methylobacterium nodulans ORS 2060]
MIIERRKAYRMDAFKLGQIVLQDRGPVDCLVWNRTPLGAMLEIEPEDEVPQRFRLVVASLLIDRPCLVRWRRGRKLGVSFVD